MKINTSLIGKIVQFNDKIESHESAFEPGMRAKIIDIEGKDGLIDVIFSVEGLKEYNLTREQPVYWNYFHINPDRQTGTKYPLLKCSETTWYDQYFKNNTLKECFKSEQNLLECCNVIQ